MKIPVGRIPKFIIARSPEGLQRLMLRVHARLGYGVHYIEIKNDFDNKKHIAWYYDNDDITLENVGEKLDNNS